MDQALMVRGSRDFATVADYQQFLRGLLKQLNAGRRDRLAAEMQYLRALPGSRLESTKKVKVRVDSGSVIYVDRNVYSVHSRLIGEEVEARLSADTVEVWYAGQKVEQLPRLRGRGKHRVDLIPLQANKRYLQILQLAAQEGEALVDAALSSLLQEGEIGEGKLTTDAIRLILAEWTQATPVTDVTVGEVALSSFDELLSGNTWEVSQSQ